MWVALRFVAQPSQIAFIANLIDHSVLTSLEFISPLQVTSDSLCPQNVKLPKVLSSPTQLWSRHSSPHLLHHPLGLSPSHLIPTQPILTTSGGFFSCANLRSPPAGSWAGPFKMWPQPTRPYTISSLRCPSYSQDIFSHTQVLAYTTSSPSQHIYHPFWVGRKVGGSVPLVQLSVQLWLPPGSFTSHSGGSIPTLHFQSTLTARET